MSIEKFEDATFGELRKNLLRQKGGGLQHQFLILLQDRDKFCQYMEKHVNITSGGQLPTLTTKMDEETYIKLPMDIERKTFEQWNKIMPMDACGPSLWGLVTFRHIEAGIIEPHFLVSDAANISSARDLIIHVSRKGTDKEVDQIVRSALRSFCGLREIDGTRGLYVHCIFACAWWRGYLCNEVCKETGADPYQVIEVFCKSPTYWRYLTRLTVSRNSVLGDMKVRNALVWALSERVKQAKYSHIFRAKTLARIGKLIGMRSAWQELGVFSMEELKEMMEKEFLVAA